jgi:enoyl-CoA hydratase
VTALGTARRLDAEVVNNILDQRAVNPMCGHLAHRAPNLARLFAGDDLDSVITTIEEAASHAAWVAEIQTALRRASPTSLRATWRRIVQGKDRTIERVLTDDYRMAVRVVGDHDFAEGVRAILVDKDQSPRWKPASLSKVTESAIDALLAPLPVATDGVGQRGGDLEME